MHLFSVYIGWLKEPESRLSFKDLVKIFDDFLEDPLHYILTTTDRDVSDYAKLPSNVLLPGESVYEDLDSTEDLAYEYVGPKLPEPETNLLFKNNNTEEYGAENNVLSQMKLKTNECYNITNVENSVDLQAKDSTLPNDIATLQCGSLNDDQQNSHHYHFNENAAYTSKPECGSTTSEEYDYVLPN